MIFPFFKRVPRHKNFHYEPRYYDPVKEELNIRTEKVKRELSKESSEEFLYRENISQAFSRRQKKDRRASGMQMALVAIFLATFVGYYYYGNAALWAFVIIFPVYIFIRSRRFFS